MAVPGVWLGDWQGGELERPQGRAHSQTPPRHGGDLGQAGAEVLHGAVGPRLWVEMSRCGVQHGPQGCWLERTTPAPCPHAAQGGRAPGGEQGALLPPEWRQSDKGFRGVFQQGGGGESTWLGHCGGGGNGTVWISYRAQEGLEGGIAPPHFLQRLLQPGSRGG